MEAQILSKKQLSSIRGGVRWQCKVVMMINQDEQGEPELIGPTVEIEADSAVEAANILHKLYGAGQINCTAL